VEDAPFKNILFTTTEKLPIFLQTMPEKSFQRCQVTRQNALFEKSLLLVLSNVWYTPLRCSDPMETWEQNEDIQKMKLWNCRGRYYEKKIW
jgi:hypothetical protein